MEIIFLACQPLENVQALPPMSIVHPACVCIGRQCLLQSKQQRYLLYRAREKINVFAFKFKASCAFLTILTNSNKLSRPFFISDLHMKVILWVLQCFLTSLVEAVRRAVRVFFFCRGERRQQSAWLGLADCSDSRKREEIYAQGELDEFLFDPIKSYRN